jgi:uncharacterized protein (TIGR03083 family)
MPDPSSSLEDWLSAAVSSHDRLAAVVGSLTTDEIAGPSYDDDWTIAQVLSHLGSGAEIFSLLLAAGLEGKPAPEMAAFQEVWDRWNAKSSDAQASDGLAADKAFLDQVRGLDQAARNDWRLDFFGGQQRLADLLRLRLGEHAVHTWDVEVIGDPTATVAGEAVTLLIDSLDQLVGRFPNPLDRTVVVELGTSTPDRRFVLTADANGMTLADADDSRPEAGFVALQLPSEAAIRLVYGRLDPHHTPEVDGEASDLDTLRLLFPGF